MSTAAVAQINVRLPRELKERGDAGLQRLGLSPSDAVRSLWTRLSERGEGLATAQAFLLGNEPQAETLPGAFDQSALAKGWHLVDDALAVLEISSTAADNTSVDVSDSDLLVEALEERMAERGLM